MCSYWNNVYPSTTKKLPKSLWQNQDGQSCDSGHCGTHIPLFLLKTCMKLTPFWNSAQHIFKINFWISFRTILKKNCKDSTGSYHIPHSHSLLLVTSYISMAHLLQLMNQYQHIFINWSSYIFQISSVFTWCPFFLFQEPIQATIFQSFYLLRLILTVLVSQTWFWWRV